jgi:hypothetical protein
MRAASGSKLVLEVVERSRSTDSPLPKMTLAAQSAMTIHAAINFEGP